MKFLGKAIGISILLCSCMTSLKLDEELLRRSCPSESGIIISCTRCSCIQEDLAAFLSDGPPMTSLQLYGDTNCVKNSVYSNLRHLSQQTLDSIYEKNYNLLLFRKENLKVKVKLLKTEESSELKRIAGEFFE